MVGFACPTCNTVMSAAANQIGAKIQCVKCGQRLQIPAPPAHTMLATPVPPAASRATSATPPYPQAIPVQPVLPTAPRAHVPPRAGYDSANCRQCGLEASIPTQGRAVIVDCARCGTKVFIPNSRPAPSALPNPGPAPVPAPPLAAVAPASTPPLASAPATASIPYIPNSRKGVLVEVSGYNILFPKACGCCGEAADKVLIMAASKSKGVHVVRTTTKHWELPYCSKCLAHITAADQARGVMVLLVLPAVVAFGGFWLLKASFFVGLVAGMITWGSGLPFYLLFLRRARRFCSPTCTCLARGGEYLGWYRTRHQFRFASRPYALAFMLCNLKKLVSLSTEASALLQSVGRKTIP
jgi:DNA-directed RNA polymerase subunit RPC12/RpoP